MVISEKMGGGLQIRLLPNRSASWRQTSIVLTAICSFSLLIGIVWAFLGAWVILPFAGLESVLLCYFIYRVSAQTYQQQVLFIGPALVQVEGGANAPVWRHQFPVQDSEFIVINPKHSLSPASITLDCAGRSLRLGEFLNREDIEQLTELIRHSGAPYRVIGKIQIHALEAFDL